MQSVSFVVGGPPVAWHRPMRSKNGRAYKHPADVGYQKLIAHLAAASIPPGWDLDGDWELTCHWYVHDRRRRDTDNLLKNVMDGLIGVAYNDDSQVTDHGRMKKRLDRENPRVVITLERPVDD